MRCLLHELETARALGVDDFAQARLDVQTKTGSAKLPGGVLHVLAIGINKFGDKAGGLHLDYAADDAHDVATALLKSQRGSLGKASLHADVTLARFGVDAWLVGRVTGQEYAKRDTYPSHSDQRYPRESWFARRDAPAYGVVIHAHGKIAWRRADIGDDPIVVVLTEHVSDAHLAGLREDGVSYIFASVGELDLGLVFEILNREGIKRLEVNGSGVTNGTFLRAGLIDEISLAIFPAVDGTKGASCVFDAGEGEPGTRAPLRSMTLASSEVLECGAVWLRYRIQTG